MLGLQKVSPSLSARFLKARIEQNRQGLYIALFIVLFAGVVFTIQHHFKLDADKNSFDFAYYHYIYVYCLSIGLLGLLFLVFSKNRSHFVKRTGNAIFFFLCVNSGVALAIGDIIFSSDLSVFIWTLLLFDILQRESWLYTLLQFIYVLLATIIGTLFLQNPVLSLIYVQLFVYTLLSFTVWFGLEKMRRSNLLFKFDLEDKIVEKEKAERDLKEAQNLLIESAYKAGLADLAGDTLHNIGNVVNSIHVSSDIVKNVIKENPGENYTKACNILHENLDNFPEFFASDPKGEQLIKYFLLLEKPIVNSFEQIDENLEVIRDKAAAIGNIIARQSKFINSPYFLEKQNMCEVVDSVIQLVPDLHTDSSITIDKQYESVPSIKLQKPSIIRILLNILDNSVHALKYSRNLNKVLMISIKKDNEYVTTSITDNGYGIAEENMDKIFKNSFTTKKGGFGLDLHNAANIINEMGGELKIDSKGINKGATVSISLPLA